MRNSKGDTKSICPVKSEIKCSTPPKLASRKSLRNHNRVELAKFLLMGGVHRLAPESYRVFFPFWHRNRLREKRKCRQQAPDYGHLCALCAHIKTLSFFPEMSSSSENDPKTFPNKHISKLQSVFFDYYRRFLYFGKMESVNSENSAKFPIIRNYSQLLLKVTF